MIRALVQRAARRTASAATSTRSARCSSVVRIAPTKGRSRFELNMAADPDEHGQLPVRDRPGVAARGRSICVPTVRDAVFEIFGGESVARDRGALPQHDRRGQRSSRARGGARALDGCRSSLSGGCFQNARLAESIVRGLQPEFTVHLHQPRAAGRRRHRARPGGRRRRKGKERSDVSRRTRTRAGSARQLAQVDFCGVCRQVRLELVDEPVAPGDYILNHVGFAIRRIPAEDVRGHARVYERAAPRGRRTT